MIPAPLHATLLALCITLWATLGSLWLDNLRVRFANTLEEAGEERADADHGERQ